MVSAMRSTEAKGTREELVSQILGGVGGFLEVTFNPGGMRQPVGELSFIFFFLCPQQHYPHSIFHLLSII